MLKKECEATHLLRGHKEEMGGNAVTKSALSQDLIEQQYEHGWERDCENSFSSSSWQVSPGLMALRLGMGRKKCHSKGSVVLSVVTQKESVISLWNQDSRNKR